ncbi:IS5 family transposase [Streptomyces monashensis]|uniref:IS5 family transposase n=1 Tax=Streptomyces monashensis TaxID=1678012 RepID=A0A1S2NSW3_9ACTN|nr:IS5 family transposase [Streptomyces monashensis]OIJ84629.1 IS5 family transposase [Streptomyces monashensis]
MSDRKPYKSDLSDERWALIEPVIAAWKADHPSPTGHQGRYKMREIVNAIMYQGKTGCQWDYLPHDLPPKSAVYYYFAVWRDDGTDVKINDLLRWQVREKAGRPEDPSLVVIDTQSVHAPANVPAATTGKDAAKKVPGRKRGVAVDVLGLVIAVTVLAASAHDNDAGRDLLEQLRAEHRRIALVWADGGYTGWPVAFAHAVLTLALTVVKRSDDAKGFVVLPRRWVVERVRREALVDRVEVRDLHQPAVAAVGLKLRAA